MKKQEVKHGQVVAVRNEFNLATVLYTNVDTATVGFVNREHADVAFRNLELVSDRFAECHGCNCTGTLYLKAGNTLECHNCGTVVQLAAPKLKPVAFNAKAIELGNLVTLYMELRYEEAEHDNMMLMAKRNADDLDRNAADRRESDGTRHYMDGAGFGFMRSRQHVEGLMEQLGLVDAYRLTSRYDTTK